MGFFNLEELMENQEQGKEISDNVSELRTLNFFWIGFIIYTSAFTISTAGHVSTSICYLFQILGLVIFVPAAFLLITLKFDNKYLKVIYSIYLLWLLTVVIRGFLFDFNFILKMVFNSYEGLFVYFSPLILLFPRKIIYLKQAINVILILGVIYTLYCILFIKNILAVNDSQNGQNILEYFSKTLSIPCGFLLITYIYNSNKKNLLALYVLLLTLILAVYRARRGLAFLSFWPIIVSYIIYLNYSKSYVLKVVIFIFLAFLIMIIVASWQNTVSYLSMSSTTGLFLDRIGQDSRSEVEQYFFRDLKQIDWIIGKGINGNYFCPMGDGFGGITILRNGIETDYLNTILKGGIISLVLQLLIAIPAIFMGIFHSKNLLSKAAGTWILFYLIDLYPSPVTTFSFNYLLVWISIGICYSRKLRDMSDNSVKEVLSG